MGISVSLQALHCLAIEYTGRLQTFTKSSQTQFRVWNAVSISIQTFLSLTEKRVFKNKTQYCVWNTAGISVQTFLSLTTKKVFKHKTQYRVWNTVGISLSLQALHCLVTEYTGRLQTETKVYKLSFAYGTPWPYQYKPFCRWPQRKSLKTRLSIAYRTPWAYQYKLSCRWPQRKSLKTRLSIMYRTPWAYQ